MTTAECLIEQVAKPVDERELCGGCYRVLPLGELTAIQSLGGALCGECVIEYGPILAESFGVVLVAEYPMPARLANCPPLDFDDAAPEHCGDVGDYTGDAN
jgi:hypothetical protein